MRPHQLNHPIRMIRLHTWPPNAEDEVIDAKPVVMGLYLLDDIIDVTQDKTVIGEFLKRHPK